MKNPPPFRCAKKKCGLYFDTIGALCLHYSEAHVKKPKPRKVKPRKFSLEEPPLPKRHPEIVQAEKRHNKPTEQQREEIRALIEDGKKRQQWKRQQSQP